MMNNMNEYESLRNEIISFEEQERNVWIYMYVIFCTLFVLGIELSYYLFLVIYIILIPFQVVINRYGWSVAKISTYIRIFYEKEQKDLKWEACMYIMIIKNSIRRLIEVLLALYDILSQCNLVF